MESIQGIDSAEALLRLGPCAVLYGASWCQSSIRLRDALAEHPHLPLVWADVDLCRAAAEADGVQGIPTVVLRHDGIAEGRRIGVKDPDEVIDWLADHGVAEPRAGRRGIIERLGVGALLGLAGAAGPRRIWARPPCPENWRSYVRLQRTSKSHDPR